MKRTPFVFLVVLLFHVKGFAQFSFQVFPSEVSGDPYADTLMNTRAVLVAAGIRQINAYQTLAEVTKTFGSKTMNLDRDGRIEKTTICMAKSKEHNFTLCVSDTLEYAISGHLLSIKTTDNKENQYPLITVKYTTEQIAVIGQGSSITNQSYNNKGQLIELRRTYNGQEIENTRFYYNGDGLLDSTYNTHWGTFIFKRRNKSGKKLIEMENTHFRFQWVYNPKGQCINYKVISKDLPNVVRSTNYKGDLTTVVRYFYNTDGTLSRITTKRSDMPAYTMQYS